MSVAEVTGPVLRPLTWSFGTSIVAALLSWFVSWTLLNRGIPADAVAALGSVALALVCLLGIRVAAPRLPDGPPTKARKALLLVGPTLLALVFAAWSTPRWFGLLSAAGIVVASLAGLWTERRAADTSSPNPYSGAA